MVYSATKYKDFSKAFFTLYTYHVFQGKRIPVPNLGKTWQTIVTRTDMWGWSPRNQQWVANFESTNQGWKFVVFNGNLFNITFVRTYEVLCNDIARACLCVWRQYTSGWTPVGVRCFYVGNVLCVIQWSISIQTSYYHKYSGGMFRLRSNIKKKKKKKKN